MGKEAAAARIPSSGGGNGDVGEGTRELKCPSRQPLRPNAGKRRFGARIARFAVPRRETAGDLNFFVGRRKMQYLVVPRFRRKTAKQRLFCCFGGNAMSAREIGRAHV